MFCPKKIGLLTIGQSPRPDIFEEVRSRLPQEWELLERGALDGADVTALEQAAPGAQDSFYVTRLRSGTEVQVKRSTLQQRLGEKILELEQADVSEVVLFCTGEFDRFATRVPVYASSALVKQAVASAYRGRTIGIVVPDAGQIPVFSAGWTEQGVAHVIRACSPYGETAESEAICREFAAAELDFILLNCIGFSGAFAEVFREKTGKQVLLPRELICKAMKQRNARAGEPQKE